VATLVHTVSVHSLNENHHHHHLDASILIPTTPTMDAIPHKRSRGENWADTVVHVVNVARVRINVLVVVIYLSKQ
jgi:hypothetical protein